MELLYLHRAGYTNKDIGAAVSIARKETYGLHEVVGTATVAGTSIPLSRVLRAATNSTQFAEVLIREITNFFDSNFAELVEKPKYHDCTEHLATNEPTPGEWQRAKELHSTGATRGTVEELAYSAAELRNELARSKAIHMQLTGSGIHALNLQLTNAVWRLCEAAILNPTEALAKEFLKP